MESFRLIILKASFADRVELCWETGSLHEELAREWFIYKEKFAYFEGKSYPTLQINLHIFQLDEQKNYLF